uniref:Ubiquitin-like protease family profile domain-containing protein n=1 Tax=Chara braunii TaxID=69332 RepID=A0A388LHS1_CHABU
MCNDGDIDMTKREGGGSYDTSAFKKFVRSQARETQMLKTGGVDELKLNAAEILALSRMNEVPQRDPIDYHELTTMLVDGVEYVLLDQIVDFMKSGEEDKNLIHEVLHEVTAEAIVAVEVVDVECVKDRTLDLVSGTPMSRWNIFEVVEELTAASTDVDRRRKRKQGWQMVVAEHDTARTHTRDMTVQDRSVAVSLADAKTVLRNPAADAVTVHGGFREWRLASKHPSHDFNEGGGQASRQGDDVVVPCDDKGDAQTGPQQENPTSWELGVSDSDISSDEEGEEYDPYWDVKRGGVRMSHITRNSTERSALAADMTTRRGKRSRTTRMRTTEEKTHKHESVAKVTIDSNQEKTKSRKQEHVERSKVETQKLDKGATHTEKRPQATTREGEEATERTTTNCRIITMEAMLGRWQHPSRKDPWYNRMYLAATRGTIQSADLGRSESCRKTTQGKKGENASSSSNGFEVVDETNIYPLTWKGKREEIRPAEADVMCLAVGKWLNDNVMDMYLLSVYEEQLQGKNTAAVHVCTTFWHLEVLANKKVEAVKRGWELDVKSRTIKIHQLCKDLEAPPVVLIPINHKHHWMMLIILNVREFWTDGT